MANGRSDDVIAALLMLLVSQAPQAPATAGPSAAPPADVEPPIIEDVAAASSNPEAAPIITVVISDRGTGVGTAAVLFRPTPATTPPPPNGAEPAADAWQTAELKGGAGGLFIARLPHGLQTSGFDFYIEATDNAGNGPARIGGPQAPIRVQRATMGTLERLRQERLVEPGPAIHPAFLMMSLGAGVLAGAGAGAFAVDLIGVNERLVEVRTALAQPDNSAARRDRLLVSEARLNNARAGDTVITSVLGVVAVAGLATGITLLVLSSIE